MFFDPANVASMLTPQNSFALDAATNNSAAAAAVLQQQATRLQQRSPLGLPLRDLTAAVAQHENRRLGNGVMKLSPPSTPVLGSPQMPPALQQLAILQAAAFAAAATMSTLTSGMSPVNALAYGGSPLQPLMNAANLGSFASPFARAEGISPTTSEYRRIRQNDPYAAAVLPPSFDDASASRADSMAASMVGSGSPTTAFPPSWEAPEPASQPQTTAKQVAPQVEEEITQQVQAPAMVKVYLNGRPTLSPKQSPSKPKVAEEASAQPTTAADGNTSQEDKQATATMAPCIATSPSSSTTGKWHAVVAFRQRTGVFIVDSMTPLAAVGNYVVVEGDRGTDVGKVIKVADAEATAEGTIIAQRVVRLATNHEVHRWTTLVREEAAALEAVRRRSREILGDISGFEIHAVEYQFDKMKLFVYYTCAERVYFVPLLKALNALYHCRIWMDLATPLPQSHHHAHVSGLASPQSSLLGSDAAELHASPTTGGAPRRGIRRENNLKKSKNE